MTETEQIIPIYGVDRYLRRWVYEWPWELGWQKSWIWHRWINWGYNGDKRQVRHSGFRVLGARFDAWEVRL